MTKYESMQIVKIPKNRINYAIISQAVRLLKQGGVLVYPTETAYGLGCDFTNKKACEKIYKIKGRKAGKKLPVIAGDFKMARRYAVFDAVSGRLAKRYWPGAVTLVLRGVETQNFASVWDDENNTIALRVSSHKIARLLSKKLGRPIVSTSANVSGRGNCYSVEEILDQFKRKKYQPDLILDYGRLPEAPSSTVARVEGGRVKVLRRGRVAID